MYCSFSGFLRNIEKNHKKIIPAWPQPGEYEYSTTCKYVHAHPMRWCNAWLAHWTVMKILNLYLTKRLQIALTRIPAPLTQNVITCSGSIAGFANVTCQNREM